MEKKISAHTRLADMLLGSTVDSDITAQHPWRLRVASGYSDISFKSVSIDKIRG
jgi:hypothetical protein